MSILIMCSNPECGELFDVPETAAGREVRCPGCGKTMTAKGKPAPRPPAEDDAPTNDAPAAPKPPTPPPAKPSAPAVVDMPATAAASGGDDDDENFTLPLREEEDSPPPAAPQTSGLGITLTPDRPRPAVKPVSLAAPAAPVRQAEPPPQPVIQPAPPAGQAISVPRRPTSDLEDPSASPAAAPATAGVQVDSSATLPLPPAADDGKSLSELSEGPAVAEARGPGQIELDGLDEPTAAAQPHTSLIYLAGAVGLALGLLTGLAFFPGRRALMAYLLAAAGWMGGFVLAFLAMLGADRHDHMGKLKPLAVGCLRAGRFAWANLRDFRRPIILIAVYCLAVFAGTVILGQVLERVALPAQTADIVVLGALALAAFVGLLVLGYWLDVLVDVVREATTDGSAEPDIHETEEAADTETGDADSAKTHEPAAGESSGTNDQSLMPEFPAGDATQHGLGRSLRMGVRGLGVLVLFVLPVVTIPLLPLALLRLAGSRVRGRGGLTDFPGTIWIARRRPDDFAVLWLMLLLWGSALALAIAVTVMVLSLPGGFLPSDGQVGDAVAIATSALDTLAVSLAGGFFGLVLCRCIGLFGRQCRQ